MSPLAVRPSLDQVTDLLASKAGNCVPVALSLSADVLTPVIAYLRLTNGAASSDSASSGSFLLESVVNGTQQRYSYVGANPKRIIRTGEKEVLTGDPLKLLETELAQYKFIDVPGIPPFTGGAIGYLSYDCIQHFEPKTARPLADPLGIPESLFMICDTIVVFDHVFQTVQLLSHIYKPQTSAVPIPQLYAEAENRLRDLAKTLQSNEPLPLPKQAPITGDRPEPVSNVGKQGYERHVTRMKEHIVKGDIIQAVPSQRLARPTQLHPFNAYRYLRQVNPSPYMFYLDCGQGLCLVGASPECLCAVDKNVVTNHAIAGTIKRGATPEEDAALAAELAASEKDRAEHIMLVDLARNDVNRVCEPTTVQVDELMAVEKFSHVMHLTSQISGTLRPGKTRFDALRSIFPAGTVSGAPKIRAMELISEMEGERRGVYAGAVGRFNFAQDAMDTCIAIRMMTFKDGVAYLQAGGGIVFDSVEEDEYVETINKLGANVRTIDRAEEHYGSLEAATVQ